jgi:hypothetical protein
MANDDWMPAAIVRPPTDADVEFTGRGDSRVHVGRFRDMTFHDRHSSEASPLQEVLLWRYQDSIAP